METPSSSEEAPEPNLTLRRAETLARQTIAALAESCRDSLQQSYRHLTNYGDDGAKSIKMRDLVGRFNIWTSNTGALAALHASLDYRLRDLPEEKELMIDHLQNMVELMNELVSLVSAAARRTLTKSTQEAQEAQDSQQDNQVHLEHVELPESSIDPEEDKKIDSMMSTLSLSLDSMRRFGNVMRRASIYQQNAKAENFRLKDANGGDAEDDIRKLFDYWIRRDFSGPGLSKTKADADDNDNNTAVVPGIEDRFKERLVETMLLRRRRILYRRSRQFKLALHTAKPIQERAPIVPIPRSSNAGSAKKPEPTPSQKSKPAVPIFVPSIAPSMPNTATTLDPVVYKREAAKPSKLSMARTVAMTKGNKDMVPLPPRLPPGALEFVCPYCCLILPAKDVADNAAWAKHVMKDLDPYVCAFFPCEQGEHLFPNSAEWAAHMKQTHCVRWSCVANTHPPARFDTEDAYIGHMKTEHPGNFSERQLPFIARSSKRPSKVIFEECPLCGMSNEDISKKNSTSATINNTNTDNSSSAMADHVAHHLQYIALLSLPLPEDADDGDDRSVTSTASSQSSKGEAASRSTLKSEKHNLPPLPFPDLDDEPYFEPDPDPPIPEDSDVRDVDFAECMDLWVDVRREGGHRAFGTAITEDEQRRDKVLETFVDRVDARRAAELELERETITFPVVPPKLGTASHLAGPDGFWMLPYGRNTEFQDRPYEMQFLTNHLEEPDSTGATSAFVAGRPGAGKSQLVLEYVHRKKDETKRLSCLWIRSYSIGSMQTDFTKATILLGIGKSDNAARRFDNVSAMHKYLSAGDRGPWIIVFDNWDDCLSEFEDAKDSTSWTTALKFADSVSRLPHVAVIITSRVVAFKSPMEPNTCLRLLVRPSARKITGSPEYDGRVSIRSIASVNDLMVKFLSTLGPGISLRLAKAYLVANPMSIEEYMDWYKDVEFAILSPKRPLESLTPTDVVCAVSLLAIAKQNALACYYALSMVGFDDTRAPIFLLLPWDSHDEQMTAIHLLCHYGLASFSPRHPTYIGLNFVIHASLILWAECVGFGYSHINTTLVTRLAHLLPETPVPNTEKMWKRILPNIASVLNYAQGEGRPQTETERLLKYKYGAWLAYFKRYKRAKPVLEDALGDNTWNDMDYDSITMSIVALLGRVELSQDGDIHEARVYLKRAFLYRQGALGLEHPDTYSVLSDLLLAYKATNHDDLVHKLERSMAYISDANNPTAYICTDCLVGPELDIRFDEIHSDDTMSSLLNLAQLYMNDDKWAAAETCLYHALGPIDQLIPIKDLRHKDRMFAQQGLRQLAVCIEAWIVLEDNSQYSGLTKTPKRLYDVVKPVTSTLRRLTKLATVYFALDRLEDAINCQKRVLDGWELLNGRDDLDTMEAEANLAAALDNTEKSIVVEDLAYKWFWRFQRNSVAAEQAWLSPGKARSEEILRDWVDRITEGMQRTDGSTDIGHFGSHLPDVPHPPSFRVQGHDDSVVFGDINNERVAYRVVAPPMANKPTNNRSSVSSVQISQAPSDGKEGFSNYSVVVEGTHPSSRLRSSSFVGRDGTEDGAEEGAEESARERRGDIPDTEETPEAEERRSRERRRESFREKEKKALERMTRERQEEFDRRNPQIMARSEAVASPSSRRG